MQKGIVLTAAILCVLVASMAGIYASSDDDVVHTIKEPVVPDKSARPQGEAAKPEVIKPLGDPSPKAEESAFAITNGTPLALIEGIFAARERNDHAWLARTLESTAGKAEITQDDCGTAWTNYLAFRDLWDRFEQAHRQTPCGIEEAGDEARVTFEVGGNAGTMFIKLKRINGGWYLLGA